MIEDDNAPETLSSWKRKAILSNSVDPVPGTESALSKSPYTMLQI